MKYFYILSRNHNVNFLLKYVGFFFKSTNISYRTKLYLPRRQLFNFYILEEKVIKIKSALKKTLTYQAINTKKVFVFFSCYHINHYEIVISQINNVSLINSLFFIVGVDLLIFNRFFFSTSSNFFFQQKVPSPIVIWGYYYESL